MTAGMQYTARNTSYVCDDDDDDGSVQP